MAVVLAPRATPTHVCTGSVSLERLLNVAKDRHPTVFHGVASDGRSAWRRFLERHPAVFCVFTHSKNHRPGGPVWRVRLADNPDWERGDYCEGMVRVLRDRHVLTLMHAWALGWTHGRRLDDFIVAYHDLMGAGAVPLPRRGDLVRLIRRHPTYLTFDPDTFHVTAV